MLLQAGATESLEKIFGAETDLFMPVAMNVKDDADVKSVIAKVVEKFGRIDVIAKS